MLRDGGVHKVARAVGPALPPVHARRAELEAPLDVQPRVVEAGYAAARLAFGIRLRPSAQALIHLLLRRLYPALVDGLPPHHRLLAVARNLPQLFSVHLQLAFDHPELGVQRIRLVHLLNPILGRGRPERNFLIQLLAARAQALRTRAALEQAHPVEDALERGGDGEARVG